MNEEVGDPDMLPEYDFSGGVRGKYAARYAQDSRIVVLEGQAVMATLKVYYEVVDFIAGGVTPQDIVAFRPSETARARFEELMAGSKAGTLSPEDNSELSHYLQIEHIMRLAKARARQHLTNS